MSRLDWHWGGDWARAMGLGLAVGLVTLAASEGEADAAVAYIRSNAGAPWGQNTNEQAMDLVFGAGGWDDLRYETVDPVALYSGTYTFIYMEGSDSNASELQTFLSANQAAVEAWVSAGGALFLNAAPNEGGSQNWGFGGVVLNYDDSSVDPGMAVDATHPIWNEPFLPTALMFTGSAYAHASVSGPGLVAHIIDSNGGSPNLAELPAYGSGVVMFGGLTTSNYWTPTPEALNLRANIIAYLAAGGGLDTDMDGVADAADNCPEHANPMQEDADMDGVGDACDACPDDATNDADGDEACDDVDNCLGLANPLQVDDDMDGQGNECDPCPGDADDDLDGDTICGDVDNCPAELNLNQADEDMDGVGDLCDACPGDAGNDPDMDGVCAADDNCPDAANEEQADEDGDGMGDACDMGGDGSSGDDGTSGSVDDSGGMGTTGAGGSGPDTEGEGSGGGGIDVTAGADDDGSGGGCGCTSAPAERRAGGWLMVVAGLVLRRRRRAA